MTYRLSADPEIIAEAAAMFPPVKRAIPTPRPPAENPAQAKPESQSDPIPLPDGLHPVEPFDFSLLPDSLRPWAADIVE